MFLLEWFVKEWKEKSTLEKIIDAIGYVLVFVYFIVLPALAFIAATEIALNPW